MGPRDTDHGHRTGRSGRRRTLLDRAIAAFLAAGLCGSGCAKTTAHVATAQDEPCDPMTDYEKCDGAAQVLRVRCDPGLGIWMGVGYCGTGECQTVALANDATQSLGAPAGSRAAICPAARTAAAGDAVVGSTQTTRRVTAGSADAGSEVDGAADGTAQDAADVAGACGDNLCSADESAGSCAWDCVDGAAAGAQCLIDKCPGASATCKSACALALAQVWACAKGCGACLSACLAQTGAGPTTFSVATCSASLCY